MKEDVLEAINELEEIYYKVQSTFNIRMESNKSKLDVAIEIHKNVISQRAIDLSERVIRDNRD